MKKTSRNSFSVTQITMVLAVLVCVLVLLLFRARLGSVLWRIIPPLAAHNPLGALSAQFVSKENLWAENAALKASLASQTAALVDRNSLYQENLALKARLGRTINVRSVLAGIVLRPPGVPYDTLVIDAGFAQNISVGDYVSAGGTALIGVVDEVYATTARVVLFSAPSESHDALLSETQAHAAIPLVVEGQGGGSLVAEIPTHTQVSVGDVVVLPGIAGGITSVVSHVDMKQGESFEHIYLRLPVNPLQLRFVEVLVQ